MEEISELLFAVIQQDTKGRCAAQCNSCQQPNREGISRLRNRGSNCCGCLRRGRGDLRRRRNLLCGESGRGSYHNRFRCGRRNYDGPGRGRTHQHSILEDNAGHCVIRNTAGIAQVVYILSIHLRLLIRAAARQDLYKLPAGLFHFINAIFCPVGDGSS